MKFLEKPAKSLPWEAFEHRKLDAELSKKTTPELIEILDKAFQPESEKFDWDTYTQVAPILAYRLGLVYLEDLNEVMRNELIKIINKQNELIKAFLNHRHDKDKAYSEKPVW